MLKLRYTVIVKLYRNEKRYHYYFKESAELFARLALETVLEAGGSVDDVTIVDELPELGEEGFKASVGI